jgi:hypothetical protein
LRYREQRALLSTLALRDRCRHIEILGCPRLNGKSTAKTRTKTGTLKKATGEKREKAYALIDTRTRCEMVAREAPTLIDYDFPSIPFLFS